MAPFSNNPEPRLKGLHMTLFSKTPSPHHTSTPAPFPFVQKSFFLVFLLFSLNLFSTIPLQLKTNNLVIYAAKPLSPNLQNALGTLDNRIDDLQMKLGIYIDEKAPIFLIQDHKSYQALTLGKDKIVEFSDAFYSGAEQRIYIRPQGELSDGYQKTLLHEYIHWYLEKIFTGAPLWFHEGMATHFSGQMGFERYLFFLQQSFLGRSSDLFRLSSSYPQNREDMQLFYLSSSMAVRYMSDKRPDQWKLFWDIVSYHHRGKQQSSFSDCFVQAYNSSMFDFHKQFAHYTKSLRYQYLFWGFNAMLAMLLPLILIWGFHNRRKRIAAMQDIETENPPDWISNHSTPPLNYCVSGETMRKKVLILCTGNSCRSIMAEALINHLLCDKWEAYSAGVNPSSVNPRAISVLKEIGIDISSYHSKSVSEFLPRTDLDLVITVCDHAHETCPVFLKPVPQEHISITDPAPWTNEPDETALPMFRETLQQIKELVIPFLQNYSDN